MKKIFLMSFVAICFFAAGCSKSNGEATYPVPTESKTIIDNVNHQVIRTQVVTEGKQAVEITYFFNENIQYNHQEWKIILSTESRAKVMGAAASVYYLLKDVSVSNHTNCVYIHYAFGEGLGDDKLASVSSLSAVETVVQLTEILNILKLF